MDRAQGSQSGSVLILMPVALLVTLLLGAIAIDAAQQFEAQRQAVADAQALANDAASALSQASLRARGAGGTSGHSDGTEPGVDPGEIDARLRADVAGRAIRGEVTWSLSGGTVTVTVQRTVALPFAPHLAGKRSRRVEAFASAQLLDD